MEIKQNFQQNDCVSFSSEAETDKNLTTAAVHVIVHMCYTGTGIYPYPWRDYFYFLSSGC